MVLQEYLIILQWSKYIYFYVLITNNDLLIIYIKEFYIV